MMSSSMGLRVWTSVGDAKKRREKLAQSQSRGTVQDLLIRRLLVKHGKLPNAKPVITSCVSRFMQQNRLTEANLLKLEKEILSTLAKPQQAKPVQTVPRPSSAKPPPPEAKGPNHGQEYLIKSMSKKKDDDLNSLGDEREEERPRVDYNEDKEWDAIQQFNSDLYHEELRQEEEKRRQQKSYVRGELDKQLAQRVTIKRKEETEVDAYTSLQKTHLQSLEAKEREKEELQKKLKVMEKARLDKQLHDDRQRKKISELDEKQQEKLLVEDNRRELEEERQSQLQKKQMERSYLQKMMEENEENKRIQLEQQKKLKEQEKTELAEYTRMLDRQEADRLEEIRARESKTQELMNKMADTVLKDLDQHRELEEAKVTRYQLEKERQDQLDDEERLRRIKDGQREMKAYLDQQTQERRERELQEKALSAKQAEIWKQDLKLHAEEDKLIRSKILTTNKNHADYLKKQMAAHQKPKRNVMTREEFLLNRKLLTDAESHVQPTTPPKPPL